MKAITLTQPYATLVAYGWKRWETRSWRTHYRGPLAIHSASTLRGVGGLDACIELISGFDPALLDRMSLFGRSPAEIITALPFGEVIAVSFVEECMTTEEARAVFAETEDAMRELGFPDWETGVGNFDDGRFAWRLRDPVMFNGVHYRGAQGLWNVPDSMIPERARKAIRHHVP